MKFIVNQVKRVKKFTLIELLTVVASVTVLAGMLIPALFDARISARRLKCTGNLKSFTQAGVLYAGSFSDYWIPPANPAWYDRIEFRRLVGAPVRPKNGLENAESAFPPDLLCPASSAVRLNRPLACFSYGMTRDNLSRDGYRRYAFRLPRILKPSGSAAWFDTLGAYAQNNPDCFPESEEGNPNGRLVYRHRRMVNVGFFDGHVAPMSPAAVACRWGSREARFNRYFCVDD